jgi:hypothetical protein
MWVTCPLSSSSGYHAEFHEGCYQKHTSSLNCRTSSSDISGYHEDFHEGHGTVGEWHGRGMTCVNLPFFQNSALAGVGRSCHLNVPACRQAVGFVNS